MQLNLSDAEAGVLNEILHRAMGDLREEIYKTDTMDYKQNLKSRESLLAAMLARLQNQLVSS